MPDVVSYIREENIAVIMIDNPPVNAMSHAVRKGVWEAMDKLNADEGADAAVLICAGRTFIAGADITEFDKPPEDPRLPDLIARMEQSPKLLVAAMHGTALGGGLETALGCHYRCALATAQVGLPEVNLGLLPGAGGTQRLPRLAGVETALEWILSGRHVSAAEAARHGVIDEIVAGDLREDAVAYAKRLLQSGAPVRRVREMKIDRTGISEDFFAGYRPQLAKQHRGFYSPPRILDCVQAAVELPFDEALRLERMLFDECKASPQSRAQRALFFAERTISKIPDVPKDTPTRDINKVAIIGAGTMGGGIAMCFANVGMPVELLELQQDALDRGIGTIRRNYEATVKRGRLTGEQVQERMALIKGALDYSDIADADLVIEAVFENMDIKKEVFSKLDGLCKQGAIMASNTSTLDVNEIAAVTARPEDVIGLHFFAPANVMRLLEVVRGAKTARDVIASAMALGKRLKKNSVLVGVCFGFVGNRMFFPYLREAQRMMLEGAAPERIDKVAYDWGMAMGPHAVADLSGLDVLYKVIEEWDYKPDDPTFFRVTKLLHDMGRYGQKTGAGIFKYEGRTPMPDPQVAEAVGREAAKLGIEQRDIRDDEIIERLFYSMINEGALILEEGIALRAGDIDVVWTSGYGMPRYRGGPMTYADMTGLKNVRAAMLKYRDRYGDRYWRPAPLLERLAREGNTFSGWRAA
ncbi:MAG: enoyl-CoA hydratase/isomerase family protein [Gammaproteobacteria bacterium]|nr:enoyl-CoA hydratase/isomerase family protein [Gammaproteobacteria bacterium]